MFQGVFDRVRLFANRVVEIITNRGVQLGKSATGKTLRSLVKNVKFIGQEAVDLEVYGSKVFEYIEQGRPAGAKMPPSEVLREWMINRGIPLEKEFAVRKSIAQKGISPVPLLETSFVEINRHYEQNLTNDVGLILSRELLEAAKRGFILPVTNI